MSGDNKALERLRALTEALPEFPAQIDVQDGVTEYEMKSGTCLAWNLYRSKDACVDKWFASAGTQFPSHAHKEREWLVVLSGAMTISYADKTTITIAVGDHVYHEPGRAHSAIFMHDCKFITVMIPAASNYPKPRDGAP